MNFKSNPKKVGVSLIASAIIGAIVSMFNFYFRTEIGYETTLNSLNGTKFYFIFMMVISFIFIYIIWSYLEKTPDLRRINNKRKKLKIKAKLK